MAKLTIRRHPDPCLSRPAEPVGEITPEVKALAADMVETMYESAGVGLAAPQVGQCCRLIVMDVSGPDKREELKILVNPVITAAEGEVTSESEGCLSVANFRSDVKRFEKVTVAGRDLDGNPVTIQAEGMTAICLQHEIDHLDGKLFIDRISRLKRIMYDAKLKKLVKARAQKAAAQSSQDKP